MATNASHQSSEICRLQKSIIHALSGLTEHLYMTDTSAASRFYLHHRLPSHLDFTIDNSVEFSSELQLIQQRLENFFEIKQLSDSQQSTEWLINNKDIAIKLNFKHQSNFSIQSPVISSMINIDDLFNIFIQMVISLSNQPSAETLLDVITISTEYQYHWSDIIQKASSITPISIDALHNNISQLQEDEMMSITGIKQRIELADLTRLKQQLIEDIINKNDNSLCPLGAELINAIIDYRALMLED